jgi:hypothetical protein
MLQLAALAPLFFRYKLPRWAQSHKHRTSAYHNHTNREVLLSGMPQFLADFRKNMQIVEEY